MKNNKNGFTLIELLAVIIILAIVALIATPIILNVIEEARLSANKTQVEMILDGAEQKYIRAQLTGDTKSFDGVTNLYNSIETTNKKPENGELYITETGQISLAISIDNVCYFKNFEADDISQNNTQECYKNIIDAETEADYDTLIKLKEDTSLIVGDIKLTQGYYERNDGGASRYEIISSSGITPNDMDYILLNNGLVAKLQIENKLNIVQLGARSVDINNYNNEEQNTTNIINYAFTLVDNIIFPSGMDFVVNDLIQITNSDLTITGNNSNLNIISNNSNNTSIIEIISANNVTIDGLKIRAYSHNSTTYSEVIKIENSNNVSINNNEIHNLNSNELFKLSNSNNINFKSNQITHDYKINSVIFNSGVNSVENNNINISSTNNSAVDIFNNVNIINNNTVTTTAKLNTIFNYQDSTLNSVVSINNNIITYGYDEIATNSSSNLIKINNTKINNNKIDITNNNIIGSKINSDGYMLIYNSIDSNEQTININDNNIENYYKRYVIGANITNLSVVPKADINTSSVSTMKSNTSLTHGTIVKTTGYHEGKTTGGTYYTIIDNTTLPVDGYEVISLNNGKYAIMYTTGQPVSVNQFGAYGDGNNGDVDALTRAFNSGYVDIYLENGEYVIDKLWLMADISHVNFDGKDNLMFFDNNVDIVSDRTQTSHEKYSEFAIRMHYSSFITFTNLKIHNYASNHFLAQFGILRSGDVSIANSEFYIAKDVESTNIDLWSDWENIVIHNNRIINEGDVWQGGNIWIRDVQNQESRNARITDNYFYKQTHDELLGIFQGEVHDVYIAGNEFKTDEGVNSTTSIINIRIGSESNTAVSGIVFENNKVDVQATMGALWGDGATDTIVRNNEITFRKVNEESIGYVIDGNSHSSGIDGIFAVFENNKITVNADSDNQTIYVHSDIDHMKDNEVTVNNKISILYSKINLLESNEATVNSMGDKIFSSVNTAKDNNIEINGYVKNIFTINTLSQPTLFENNTINYNYDQKIVPADSFSVISINNVNLNNHSVTFNNNRLNHPQADMNSVFIYGNIKDTTTQNIYLNNNYFAGYTSQRLYPSKDLFNIEIVN